VRLLPERSKTILDACSHGELQNPVAVFIFIKDLIFGKDLIDRPATGVPTPQCGAKETLGRFFVSKPEEENHEYNFKRSYKNGRRQY
jgi:hypothetical protein